MLENSLKRSQLELVVPLAAAQETLEFEREQQFQSGRTLFYSIWLGFSLEKVLKTL